MRDVFSLDSTKSIILLVDSQVSPIRPSDRNSISTKTKTLEW
jgi:hypothetical protein